MKKPGLGAKILIGLGLGIFVGLFFGEHMAPLAAAGNAFVGLLQMTVLPYLAISLVAAIGSLDVSRGKRLVAAGAISLALIWMVGLAMVWLAPATLPTWDEGSFFSTSLVEERESADLLELFIPANIFRSLANNLVPAVVLFCVFLGVAILRIEKRGVLLETLEVVIDALGAINRMVIKLTPYGVFAIAASTAGTMSLGELSRLQAYLYIYGGSVLLLAFVILPLLLASFTPFSYRDIMRLAKEPIITAFATGKTIVVLPMLVENTRKLVARYHDEYPEMEAEVTALYPLGYPFPNLGKVSALIFIPFAAWFVGKEMGFLDYPGFLAIGLVSYFGGPIVATPFMLDYMELPADLFQLFLVSGIVASRLAEPLGVMHLVSFTLGSTSISHGMFRPQKRLVVALPVIAGCVIAVLAVSSVLLKGVVSGMEKKSAVLARMHIVQDEVEAVEVAEAAPNPVPLKPGQSRLDRIRERGVLRVGVDANRLPFAFRNARGELVGFDVNMAHMLARDLDVSVEFIPMKQETLVEQLEADHFDTAMSGLIGTLDLATRLPHSIPYLDITIAFVVPDRVDQKYRTVDSIRRLDDVAIGVVEFSNLTAERIREIFGDHEIVALETQGDYFEEKSDADVMITSAESGSAWTLLYPQYGVVIPDGFDFRASLLYPVPRGDSDFEAFLLRWVDARAAKRDELYAYWILGKTDVKKAPRWSIMRDVLEWED